MVDKPSNAFLMIKEQDVEKNIFEKVHNKEHANLDERIINKGRIDRVLQIYQEQTSRSSETGQRLANQPNSISTPDSNGLSNFKFGQFERTDEASNEDDKEENNTEDLSEDESWRAEEQNKLNRLSVPNEAMIGTEKGLSLNGHPKKTIEHFSKLTFFVQTLMFFYTNQFYPEIIKLRFLGALLSFCGQDRASQLR